MRNLYFGLQGEDVKRLQEKLEVFRYATFTPTTFFGIKTHLAVLRLQKDYKLPQNGIFGSTEAYILGITDPISNATLFFNTAMSFLGKDVTPQDSVDDDVACMETIDTIYKTCFGNYISGNKITISTLEGFRIMRTSYKFKEVKTPEKGDILIYPTGLGIS